MVFFIGASNIYLRKFYILFYWHYFTKSPAVSVFLRNRGRWFRILSSYAYIIALISEIVAFYCLQKNALCRQDILLMYTLVTLKFFLHNNNVLLMEMHIISNSNLLNVSFLFEDMLISSELGHYCANEIQNQQPRWEYVGIH